MRRAAALAALLLLAPRPAAAEVLDGWPCAGCITITPEGAPAGPRPLLVALHGDGGGVRPLVKAWKAAASAAGVILVAPRCPQDKGCKAGSWWQWYDAAGHDPAWLGAQIDAVTGRFEVDPKRVYATGYSGGATYLGWYAPTYPTRFAAVAHVAGGAAYRPPCPACKLPVLFVLGAADPMLVPYTRPLRDYYEACGGHEIEWETLRGVTHESILGVLERGRAREILAWLLARPAKCGEEAAPVVGVDAGSAPEGTAEKVAVQADAGALPAMPVVASEPPGRVVPPSTGCACEQGAPVGEGWAMSLAVLLLALGLARRGTRPLPGHPVGTRLCASAPNPAPAP